MKKLLFMFVAVLTLGFVSCDKANNTNNENADSTAFNIENVQNQLLAVTDSAAADSLLASVQAEAERLISEGKTTEAQSLLDQLKQFIETNKEKLTATVPAIGTMFDKVAEIPALKELVNTDSLKAGAQEAVDGAVENVKDAAAAKAGEVVDKAGEAVENAADKAGEAVDKAADKAAAATKNAADEAKKKIGL